MDCHCNHTVLVTGFGPFGKHVINASWEAVKELRKICANSDELRNVKIHFTRIPVSYKVVSNEIPKLWQEHNPTIVLHVGVSAKAKCLTIEEHAYGCGYIRPDVCNEYPDESSAISCDVKTDIDVKKICDFVNSNSSKTGCMACTSQDAGRYLCEYIYYKSLCIGPTKTLFVHVPDFDIYSSPQTAKGLYDILRCMIKSLKNPQ